MDNMNMERAEIFRPHIESKLKEQKIDSGDHKRAIEALKPCVLGVGLIRAYKTLNGLNSEI